MKFRSFAAFVFILILTNLGTANGFKNKSAAYLLYQHILLDQEYKADVRPAINSSQPTIVNISLNVLNIIDYDEVTEQLALTGELKISWIDEYLTWDPEEFDGLKIINLPQNIVWKPDIGLDNSVTKHSGIGSSSLNVLVSSDGHVLWNPMEVFQSTCPADVTNYPMDTQTCCLDFEAWNFPGSVVQIKKGLNGITLDHAYDGLPKWLIAETTAEEQTAGGDYYVVFCIRLKRQSLYVMLNVILPIALLSLLNSCVFLLPAASGEKASFSVTVFLSVSVFLTIISAQLPVSDKLSIFNLYVFFQVLISTFVTITALVQIRLYHRHEKGVVPLWLRRLVGWCRKKRNKTAEETRVINVKTSENGTLQDSEEKNEHNTEQSLSLSVDGHVTWKLVSDWLDYVMFILFISLNAVFVLGLMIWSVCV